MGGAGWFVQCVYAGGGANQVNTVTQVEEVAKASAAVVECSAKLQRAEGRLEEEEAEVQRLQVCAGVCFGVAL